MLHDGIEIKNTDMGFYIKEFEARGNGKKPAHVSFINGCNVIHGGSDNGKTTLFRLIDFILGKSSKDIPLPHQGNGYTDFYLEIRDEDNVAYTLHRKNGEKDINVKKTSLEDYEYVNLVSNFKSYSSASHPLSKYLLQLSDIEDVFLRNGSKKIKLSYSHIRHLFMVDEERFISEKNSPLIPEINYDVREVYKSIISYLVTGIDDKEYHPEEKASVRKTRLNGKREYLLEEIDKAKTKLNSLGDTDYITITDKGFLDNTEFQLKDFSIKLDELYEKKNKYKEDLERLLRLLKNQELFIGKLKGLLATYKQDLNRLNFVNSGFSMMSALGNVKCPLCGSDVAIESLMGTDSDVYEKAIEKEYANTCFKIKDIENLIASKEQDSQRTANKVGELNLELTRINNEIDEVKPNVSQLKHVFSVAQRNIEKKFKHQELERFINDKIAELQTLETLIKNCNSKSDSVEYFKEYMPKELLDEIKDTLNAWKYECNEIKNVSFDDKVFDIMIDGRTRTSYGKGNRSVSTAAVMISLFDYIHEKGRAFSDILILDSPLCTKYDNKIDVRANDEDALTPKGVIDSFAKYCNDKDWKYQIIILDNKITNDIEVDTLTNINLIEFGTAERYGLFYE